MVRAAVAAVEATRQIADELAGLASGRVSVGMVTGCTVAVLFDALSSFHHQFPGIEIVLTEDASDRLVDGVLRGRFDLALLGIAQDCRRGAVADRLRRATGCGSAARTSAGKPAHHLD